jgi:hypothetical protein
MSTVSSTWVEALTQLRAAGWRYDQIGPAVGSSARSVRRWDRLRVRLQQGGKPEPALESAPLHTFALKLVELAQTSPETVPAPAAC